MSLQPFDKTSTVSFAKLKQLNDTNLHTQISNVLLAFLAYVLLKTKSNETAINIWFFIFMITAFIRLIVLYIHKKSYETITPKQIANYLKQYQYGIFIGGTLWGVAIFMFYPEKNLESIFYLVFIVMGLTTGAFIVNSIDMVSAFAYPFTLLLPLTINLYMYPLNKTFPILFGTTLYFIFLLVNTKRITEDRQNYLSYNYDLVASEKEKAASEERYRLLLNHSPIGIVHYDLNMEVSYCNEQFIKIMGVDTDKIRSINLDDLKDQAPIKTAKEALKGKMTEYSGFYEMSFQQKILWIHVLSSPVKDENENIIGGVSIIQDATEQKNAEDEIKKLAFYDPLTLLPNRRMFMDRLNESLLACKHTHNHGSIMFLDLDRFKTLNDTLGHDYGDLLLQKVAERLKMCIKKGDIVARFGGDEFVILLNGLDKSIAKMKQDATRIATRILNLLNEPFNLLGHNYQTSPSIGVVVFGEENDSQEDLIKYADIAMYQAKKSGRNIIKFFDQTMQHEITKRVDMENQLQNAIKESEFVLHYQPQISKHGLVYGAEVLVRWQHPKKGLVFPLDFIDIAEDTGLIIDIGYQILEIAMKQLAFWKKIPHLKNIEISINISAIQFIQDDFTDKLLFLLEKYQINPLLIKLEITEGVLLECTKGTVENIIAIRDKGVRFSLDDFGTGYSSLNYLKKLPIDELKIDQSFVRDIVFDANDHTIIQTIVAVADSFNFGLIAEGVETQEQYNKLLELGCSNFQGYLFSRPVSVKEFEQIVEDRNLV